MTLTLVAVSLNEQPLSQPITASFDARGGTIGRADHNTMALPDPQRHVSRRQAEIVAHGTTYSIRNVGAANPITVGGRSLGPGEAIVLSEQDQIRIGGYLLQVQFEPEDRTAPLHLQGFRQLGRPLRHGSCPGFRLLWYITFRMSGVKIEPVAILRDAQPCWLRSSG